MAGVVVDQESRRDAGLGHYSWDRVRAREVVG